MRTDDLVLALIAPVILVILIFIFVRRGLYREFPFFFVYILYSPLATARAFIHRPMLHFVCYWITEAIYGILALLVMREVFRRLFALPSASFRWFRWLLSLTVLALLIVTLWETFYHPLRHGRIPRWVSGIYWFDVGVHALEGTILLLVLALTTVFPVAWRQYEFSILTGFGISASVTMVADLLRFQFGSNYETFFRYGPPIAYIAATLIWLQAFFRPPKTTRPQMDLDELLEVVRRSRELMEKLLKALGLNRRVALPPV
ncbi:MAG TPA: hypothetical protein VKY85_26805 [Candidatus Angelobacter sp.]|nr:hypothetical protein [Candidatus Angelobacter sp.]